MSKELGQFIVKLFSFIGFIGLLVKLCSTLFFDDGSNYEDYSLENMYDFQYEIIRVRNDKNELTQGQINMLVYNNNCTYEQYSNLIDSTQMVSNQIICYIDSISENLKRADGFKDGRFNKPYDIRAPYEVMIEQGAAEDLKSKIRKYTNHIHSILNQVDSNAIKNNLVVLTFEDIDDDKNTWVNKKFFHKITIMVEIELISIKMNLLANENNVLRYIFNQEECK